MSLVAFILVACGNGGGGSDTSEEGGAPQSGAESGEPARIALLIQTTGDLSFNDSAVEGMESAREEHGDQVEIDVIEVGEDTSNYEASFLDTADAGYDMMILVSQFEDYLVQYAEDYPETAFVLFDTEYNFEENPADNVYSIIYSENEASFLGGYLAAKTSESGKLGFVGGMENPTIQNFLVGYIEGAQKANPDVEIMTSYIGSWTDSARGKELALAMYDQDASTVFVVSGGASAGMIEAAIERDGLILGVDSDMAMMYEQQGQEEYAQVIPTSVMKNVGESLHRAINLYLDGELVFGENEILGFAENGVGLADNEYFREYYDEETIQEVEDLRQQIIDGELDVTSSRELTVEEVHQMQSEVAP